MTLFLFFLAPFLMIGIGLGAGVVIARKYQADWGLYAVGAATFIGSQVFHIPFNLWVLNPLLQKSGLQPLPGSWGLLALGLALGLSAGVFEECARYLVYRFWQKQVRSWRPALMFGAGHGGIEAIILGGLSLFTVIQIAALRSVDLASVVPVEQLATAQAQIEAFWQSRWYDAFLAVVERAGTVPLHMALALMVLQAIRQRQPAWLGLAILVHTLLNAIAVFGVQTWGVYLTEAFILLAGLASLAAIWAFKKSQDIAPALPEPIPPVLEPGLVSPPPGQQTLSFDDLEDSRYVE